MIQNGPHPRSSSGFIGNYPPKWGILGEILDVLMLRFVMQSTFKIATR